ncbi:N-acetyltransferase family protein [Phenylobacterium sp.]|uniref:GNAT family N-acetyltransferase n=1 Tax=Phenylobacterium sp. TaxID=1871053 RepID=UPI003D2B4916
MILRPATPDDAPALAAIHILAMRTLTFLPQLHTIEEAAVWMFETVLPTHQVTVADVDGEACGYIASSEGWIDQLYVHPDHHGRGVGGRLLESVLAEGGTRQLWTFQQNARARAFYESRGFRAVEFTDGSGNEEKTPDVRYIWDGPAR